MNITLTEGSHWGVLIMQSGAMTVRYTVTPGNRSLFALLGSFGGAYGLLYVPGTTRLSGMIAASVELRKPALKKFRFKLHVDGSGSLPVSDASDPSEAT
jgi:hypothetical protein